MKSRARFKIEIDAANYGLIIVYTDNGYSIVWFAVGGTDLQGIEGGEDYVNK